MRGRILILSVLLMAIVIGVIVIIAASQTLPKKMVKVQSGEEIICIASSHLGDKVIKSTKTEITVPENEAKNYRMTTTKTTCSDCQPVDVKTGERVLCSKCGKIIKNTVETINVPKRDSGKYKVTQVQSTCSACREKRSIANKTPKQVVREFFRCLESGEIQKAKQYLAETVITSGPLLLPSKFSKEEFARWCSTTLISLEIHKEFVRQSSASVQLWDQTDGGWLQLLLSKENGMWVISGISP